MVRLQIVGDGRECLGRHGIGVLRQVRRRAVGVIAGVVVVEQVVGTRRAVAVTVRRVGQRRQVTVDRGHTGSLGVGAFGVAATRVAVLGVVVVGSRHRVGVLDLRGRRGGQLPVAIAVHGDVGVTDGDVVGPCSAHDRLVVVVRHGIVVADEGEGGGVAGGHVVVAHLHRPLVGGLRGTVTVSGGLVHPGPQPVVALVHLLPHLVEAVQWIADVGACLAGRRAVRLEERHVVGDLVGAVRQVGGEAAVGGVGRLLPVTCRVDVRGVGLGQAGVRLVERRGDGVAPGGGGGVGGRVLRCFRRVGSQGALGGHDALRNQVVDAVAGLGQVGAEDVVEAVVLPDDNHHVVDRGTRRGCGHGLHSQPIGRVSRRRLCGGDGSEGNQSKHRAGCRQTPPARASGMSLRLWFHDESS